MYGGIKAWALATAAALGLAAFAAPVHAGETASGHVDQVSTLLGTPYSSAIEGFASRDSVLAGEEISFAVASDRPWRMDVFRVGAYGSGDALLSYSSGEFQPANVDVAAVLDPVTLMVSAPWTVTNSVSTTGFRSGLYVARIADDVGAQNLIPFIVRDGDLRGRTVVVAGFATYQAYNAWGGKNAYRDIVTGWRNRSRVVSMDRPLDARGLAALQAYEFTTAIAVDSAIGDAAWATGQDVSEGRVDLTGVATIVSPGHDEYWSGGQRDAIDAAVAGGSNLFVTGANAGYWQVRFESPDSAGVARRMAIYKNHRQDPVFATNPSAATVRFEGRHIRRPITLLTGLTYNCFPSSGEFTVTDNSWWGFAGTGVQPGQSFAGLSGRESDGYRGGQGPGVRVQVVADSIVGCKGRNYHHSMVYATHPSGAGVIATGSMEWPCAMATPCATVAPEAAAFARTVTRTILLEAARGPLAVRFPIP